MKNKILKKALTYFMEKDQVDYIVDGYINTDNYLSTDYNNLLKESILDSAYLAKNHLNYNFSNTQGFSIIFKNDYVNKVIEKFPYLTEFLEKIIEEPFNAFYLNPLVLPLRGKVNKHIDHSLRSYYLKIPFPKRVVVYYVDIPDMSGGNLILYNEDKFITKIKPQTNKMIFFKGDIKHEITTISELENSKAQRISLVCEQYNLDKYSLSQIPNFLIRSDASFNAFLADQINEK